MSEAAAWSLAGTTLRVKAVSILVRSSIFYFVFQTSISFPPWDIKNTLLQPNTTTVSNHKISQFYSHQLFWIMDHDEEENTGPKKVNKRSKEIFVMRYRDGTM